jgi:hypothetical protein
MDSETASLISNLLYKSSWIDDGDELLLERLDGSGIQEARKNATLLDSLIASINGLVHKDKQINLFATFVDTLEELINEQLSVGTELKL